VRRTARSAPRVVKTASDEFFFSETIPLTRLRVLVSYLDLSCRRVIAFVFCLAVLPAITPGFSASGPRGFDIPAGDAADTLKLAAQQGGLEIVFFVETVRGIRTPALRGNFTPHEALERLVADAGLVVSSDGPGAPLTVRRKTPSSASATQRDQRSSMSTDKSAGETTSTPPTMKKSLLVRLGIVLGLLSGTSVSPAQVAATGSIQGRVLNATNDTYIEKARVTVEGTSLETFTDSAGNYRLTQVPAGTAKVKTFFTGLVTHSANVVVSPGQIATHDVTLEGLRTPGVTDSTIRLSKFVVTASAEMDGAARAINEQRFAPNVMNVVDAGEFGSMAEGNVAEFMKFLPGVTMDVGESGDANTVSINGVPAANVPISVGGFDLASANQNFGSGTGREVNLDQVSLNSIARIEVAYTPTPEITGSALAGSVNMVPRSAFERSRPVFTGSAFIMIRDSEKKTLGKTPGPGREPTRKIHPGFDFSYIVPVNKRFGFTISGGTSTNHTPENGVVRTWRGSSAATNGLTAPTAATQYPDTTPDRPYLSHFALYMGTKVTTRTSIGATADFKLTPNGTLSFSFQYANYDGTTHGHHLNFTIQRVNPGDFTPTSTRGTGELELQNGDYNSNGTTYMPSLTYRHNGSIWKSEAGVGLSHGTNHIRDISKGFFNGSRAGRTGVTISFNDINYLRPGTISVVDTATGAPVDPYSISNYTLRRGNQVEPDGRDTKRTAFANLRRDFYGRLPASLKAGVDFRQSIRDSRRPTANYFSVGADGRAETADDNALVVLDESISQRVPANGFPRVQWVDNVEYWNLYRANPSHFSIDQLAAYNTTTASSKHAEEIISSGYLRGDLQLFNRRLKLVGGVRAEQTNVKAEGQLLDPTRNFQRDASGKVVLGPTGTPQLIAPAGTLAAAQLTTLDRGLHASKEYLRWFPSLNASFNLRDNLIARAGHYWTVGRPNFAQYAGALNLPNTENPPSASNRISVANAGIKAWSAKTTKVSLEYYLGGVGLVSVSAFRRDFENFFGSTVFEASPQFLSLYNLDPQVYGDYDVATQYNLPSRVRMTGVDFSYKQALTFLPAWARGVQIFANASGQRATGAASDNFAGYVPRTYSGGISLSREKFRLRANMNYRGRARGSLVTGRSIEPSTYNWDSKRCYIDLSGEYSLTRRLALFANLRNVGDAGSDANRAGPNTPAHAELRARETWGSLWTFGVKGTF
jgi:iron complex outermembrane receptor protein